MSARIRNNRIEYLIYFLFWGVLVLAPFSANIFSEEERKTLLWDNIYLYWLFLSPVLFLFLINNYILLPRYFIRKKQKIMYFLLVLLCLLATLFVSRKYIVVNKFERPALFHNSKKHADKWNPGMLEGRGPKRTVFYKYDRAQNTVHDVVSGNRVYYYIRRLPPPRNPEMDYIDFMLEPYLLQLFLMLMSLVLNDFVKLCFITIRNEKELKELEYRSLLSELEYLKFQINPHFFMNTLNNIHVLIDIDKQKAREAVINISKMMRYILYETSSNWVNLDKEIAFLKGYMELMRMRYNANLTIKTDFPSFTSDCSVPSSLFVSFVENAFKHGIRLKGNSEIEISIKLEDNKLIFKCRNTIGETNVSFAESKKGIGLDNARKRLSLLYDSEYTLDINKDDIYYNVLLKIPISHDEVCCDR